MLGDICVDGYTIHFNPMSCAITFCLRPVAEGETSLAVIRVRLPLPLAKCLGLQLTRIVRSYEQDQGIPIEVPEGVLQSLEISPEDWHTPQLPK